MLPLPILQSRNFIQLLSIGEKYNLIGHIPTLGKRYKIWFLTIDFFVCENEPKINNVKGIHIIGWHKPKDKDLFENIKIKGWFGPFGKHIPIANPIPHIDVRNSDYFKLWTKRKQTYRNVWLRKIKSGELSIEKVDMNTFLKNYISSNLPEKIIKFNKTQLLHCLEIYREKMMFYIVRDNQVNQVVAGASFLHDSDIKQLIKQYSFTNKEYKYVGVGIMDFCIQYAKDSELEYINLTLINTFGHSKRNWEGFTKFKLEFSPIILYFRQSYIKCVLDFTKIKK